MIRDFSLDRRCMSPGLSLIYQIHNKTFPFLLFSKKRSSLCVASETGESSILIVLWRQGSRTIIQYVFTPNREKIITPSKH